MLGDLSAGRKHINRDKPGPLIGDRRNELWRSYISFLRLLKNDIIMKLQSHSAQLASIPVRSGSNQREINEKKGLDMMRILTKQDRERRRANVLQHEARKGGKTTFSNWGPTEMNDV